MMRRRPTVEALEQRLLYSADSAALAAAVLGPPAVEQRVIDGDAEFAPQTEQAVQSAPQEIVFIDARTPDSAQLVHDIAAQSGRQVEVVVLDAERNGLEQITEALAGRENVAALHFIAHGGEGVMQLGNALVTADALERNPGLVEAWSKVFTADADILLYGCDIAATAQGRLLADTLARLTGADVSASDDATGHASLGGDWNLEYATGAIDVPVAPSESAQDAWSHLLPSVVLTSYEPPFANMVDNAYEIAGGTTFVQSFSHVSGAGTYTVNQIDLVLYRNAVTNGANIDVELRDAPSGGTLLASGSVSRAELGTSENYVVVSLDAAATLTDGTTYYIRIRGTGAGNVYVGVDDPGTYAGGNFINDGTPEPAKDMAFRVVFTDGPVVDLNGNQKGQDFTAAFTEQTPVLVTRNTATITDPDSANLASLTATLAARPDGDAVESLSLNAAATTAASGAGLTVGYTAGTGVLSITGSASVATYQTILRGIQYNNTSDAPTTTDRSVTVVASDGATPSAARTSVITVTAVDDVPVVDLNAGGAGLDVTVAFTEQTPAPIAPVGTLAGIDSGNLASLTATLTARPDGDAVESLSLNAAAATTASGAGLTVTYTAATGVLFITGSASVATYQAILQGIQYNNTSDAPTTTNRSVTVVANDGTPSAVATSTVTVAAVNDAPVVDLNAGGGGQDVTVAFTEQTPVLIAPVGTLADVDSAALASLTLTLTARPDGDAVESLSLNAAAATAASGAGLTVGYTAATGVLSITGSASVATYQAILQGIQYNNTSDAPTTTNRSVTVVANDGTPSAVATSTVTVTALNDAPVLAGAGGTLAYTEGDAATVIDATLTVSDVDDVNIESATVTISTGLVSAEDVLGFTSAFGITGSYTAATGVLALSGSATLAQYESVLGSVTYQNTNADNPNTGARTVTWVVNDGAANSAGATSTVTVAAVNDAPANTVPGAQSTNEDAALVFSAGNGNAISIADVDAGASPVQVVLTGANGAITLAGIAGLTFSVGDGTADAAMTFSGTAGAINAALNGLSFTPGAEFSGAASLSISTDDQGNTGAGGALSDSDAVAITVNVVNDAPMVTTSGAATTFTGGGGAVLVDGALAVGDVDNATLAAATVSISGGFQAGQDVLGFSSNPVTMGNVAGGYNAASGVLSLSSAGATATLAQWQAALRSVTYDNANPAPSMGIRAVSFDVSDGNSYGPVATQNIAVNPAPSVPAPVPPPVIPPPVIPPVVVLPPPVTPPPAPPPQQTPPTVTTGRPAGAAAAEESAEGSFLLTSVEAAAATAGVGQHFAPQAAGVSAIRLASFTAAPGVPGAELQGELLQDALRQLETRQLDLFPSEVQLRRLAETEGLGNDLARLRDSLREQEDIQTRTVVTLAAGSLSMTLAYLLWLVRGGALAASMLSALPAWRLIDPLPILARVDDKDDESAEEDDQAVAPFSWEPDGGRIL